MKHTSLLVGLGLFGASLSMTGQNIETLNSEFIGKRKEKLQFIGKDERAFYALYKDEEAEQEVILKKLSLADLHVVYDQSLSISKICGPKARYHGIQLIDGKLWLLSSRKDKASGNDELMANAIAGNGKADTNAIRLLEKTASKQESFYVLAAADSSHLLVYSWQQKKSRESTEMHLRVLDGTLQVLHEATLVFPYSLAQCKAIRPLLAKDGTLGFYRQSSPAKKERSDVDRCSVLLYDWQLKTLSEIPLTHPGNYVLDMQLLWTENKTLRYAGFYSELKPRPDKLNFYGSETRRVDGVFNGIIDLDSKKVRYAADSSLSQKLSVLPYDYYIDYCLPRSNGGLLLTAEVKTSVTMTSGGVEAADKTAMTNYSYKNILLLEFGPQAQVLTLEQVTKCQEGRSLLDPFYSYLLLNGRDKVILLYNDHRTNVEATPPHAACLETMTSSVTKMLSFDEEGHLSGHYLSYDLETNRFQPYDPSLDTKGKKDYRAELCYRQFLQINDSEGILYNFTNNSFMRLRIE